MDMWQRSEALWDLVNGAMSCSRDSRMLTIPRMSTNVTGIRISQLYQNPTCAVLLAPRLQGQGTQVC